MQNILGQAISPALRGLGSLIDCGVNVVEPIMPQYLIHMTLPSTMQLGLQIL